MTFNCKYCSSERKSKLSLIHHERTCIHNSNRVIHKRSNQFLKAKKLGLPVPKGNSTNYWLGKKHSEETKALLRKRQKEYLTKNPHMSPWVHSHYSKRKSYAQQYWERVLCDHNIKFQDEVPYNKYRLDIYIESSSLNIEIDGEQHYKEGKLRPSDVIRDEYTKANGIETCRIRWSTFKKLTEKEKQNFIASIIQKIHGSVT